MFAPGKKLKGSLSHLRVINPEPQGIPEPLPERPTLPLTAEQVLYDNAVLKHGVHFLSCSPEDRSSGKCFCRHLANREFLGGCSFMSLANTYDNYHLVELLSHIELDGTPCPSLAMKLKEFLQDVEKWFEVPVQIPTDDEMVEIAKDFCKRMGLPIQKKL